MPSPKRKSKPRAPKKSKSPIKKPKSPRKPLSPLTGLPVREKIHLPIPAYGRLNSFQVLQNLFGKSPSELKQILDYELSHQSRRMVTDRIQDMLRRR